MMSQPDRVFRFRLALSLGCTVAELGRRVTSRELIEWQAYGELEPFGPPAHAYDAGVIAATVANAHRGKGREPFKPADFTPHIIRAKTPAQRAAEKRQAAAGLSARLRAFFGGAVNQPGEEPRPPG